jgi:hypothetical protein
METFLHDRVDLKMKSSETLEAVAGVKEVQGRERDAKSLCTCRSDGGKTRSKRRVLCAHNGDGGIIGFEIIFKSDLISLLASPGLMSIDAASS